MNFTEFKLNENLIKGIDSAGYATCLPVQEKTLVHTLIGRDVCVQSQTGTGKTAAFLVSIFQLLQTDESLKGKKAIIIAPTRELAIQIEKEAKMLGSYLDFLIGCFYGGVGYNKQEKLLRDNVDIIIGTPGRLLDFKQSGKMNLGNIGILVIDEADRLFDMGFFQDIKRLIKGMPHQSKRKTMLFSATLSDRVKSLAGEFMNDPVEIVINPEQVTVDMVSQEVYHVGKSEKISLLLGILNHEKPKNAIIFANTKHVTIEVSKRLEYNGYLCEYIIGDLPQSKRLKIIEGMKAGKIQLLVATNVAARGLHIDDLELVINYDLPVDREDYVHRIGRTARAGKSGRAISLACEEFVYGLEAIESFTNMKIPVKWAGDDMYLEDKSAGIRIDLRENDKGKRGRKTSTNRSSNFERTKRKKETVAPEKKYVKKREKYKDDEIFSAKKQEQIKKDRIIKEKKQEQIKKDGILTEKKQDIKKNKIPPKDKKYKKKSEKDRLEYYNQKYGDNFKIKSETSESIESDAQKGGFVKKIFNIFKNKKKIMI